MMTEQEQQAGNRALDPASSTALVNLYWIPLGAVAHAARISGKVFEAASAFLGRRPRCALYHSALEITTGDGRYVVEQTPVPDDDGGIRRGVVASGPVGLRWLGKYRIFRYEIRRWRDGTIPDVHDAVGGPQLVSQSGVVAQRILDVLPLIPTPVWGRDELRAGEMWNSNSVVAWVLTLAGVDAASLRPPAGGRAPGWCAGIAVAGRSAT